MKKVLSVLLSTTLVLSMATTAFAAETETVEFYYDLTTSADLFSIDNVAFVKDANDNVFDNYYADDFVNITTLMDFDSLWISAYTYKDDGISLDWNKLSDFPDAEYSEMVDDVIYDVKAGSTFYFDVPGYYSIHTLFGEDWNVSLEVIVEESSEKEVVVEEPIVLPETCSGIASTVEIKVDYEDIYNLASYNIDGTNYLKLRDVATIMSDTGAKFDVTWDNDLKAINLVTGTPYTSVGGELEASDGVNKTGTANTATIYKDGVQTSIGAYVFDGNTYFQLRDLGDKLNFLVDWNSVEKLISIEGTH